MLGCCRVCQSGKAAEIQKNALDNPLWRVAGRGADVVHYIRSLQLMTELIGINCAVDNGLKAKGHEVET